MTRNPVTIEAEQPVVEAARRMRHADAGAIVVLDNGQVSGIVTDRDITVRVVAEERDPATTSTRSVVSDVDVATVGPDTSVEQAAQLMQERAVRRLPVVEAGSAVGVVSLGDLAIERDPSSVLGQISAAESNT